MSKNRTSTPPSRRGGRPRAVRPLSAAVKQRSVLRAAVLTALLLGVAFCAAALTYELTYDGRIVAGVSSMGISLGGRTRDEARALLSTSAQRFAETPVVLRYQAKEWRATLDQIGLRLQTQDTLDEAYAVGRDGALPGQLASRVEALVGGRVVGRPGVDVDLAKRAAYVARLAGEIDQAPADARLVVKSGQGVDVQKSKVGRKLNADRTVAALDRAVSGWGMDGPSSSALAVDLVVEDVAPALTEEALAPVADRARQMAGAPVVLRYAGQSWTLDPKRLLDLLTVRESGAGAQKRVEVEPDDAALGKALDQMAASSEQKPRNARFDYSGGRLTVVSPGVEGKRIDVGAAVPLVRAAILGGNRTVDLPSAAVKPEIGPDDGAKLEIHDLIQQSSTDYDVGSADRRFNVELAASRLHGVVVGPGETFSFNDEVGEVSYRNGYKQGYGISRDSDGDIITIPSEGGGICQVATTLFHSVFWGGYQIVERHWHSYWIPRYGMPPKGLKGLDATIDQVFDKSGKLIAEVDLRFRNNTDHYLLIQARTDKKNVTFQLYGTKPDWEVKVGEPKIEKEVKADPTIVRQPDPTLAPGAQMMIEEARDGFQASITRTVSQGGKVLEQKTFVSTYAPSRNVYVYGPTPTPGPKATPKPAATPTR